MTEKISAELCEELQYYVGKVCTIIMPPTAADRLLDLKKFHSYYTVRIQAIDQEAILGIDPVRNTKLTFMMPVRQIVEEQVIDESHPEYANIKEKALTQKKPVTTSSTLNNNINELQQHGKSLGAAWPQGGGCASKGCGSGCGKVK